MALNKPPLIEEVHVVFWQHYYLFKGTFVRAFKIAEQLARPGFKIWISGVDPALTGWLPVVTPADSHPNIFLIRFPGAQVRDTPLHILRRILAAWIWILTRAPRFNIGHFFALGHPFSAFTSPLLAWRKCRRRYLDWDDLWGDGYAQYTGRVINRLLRALEQYAPRMIRAERATTVSTYLYEQLTKIGFPPDKIHMIGNGLDVQADDSTCESETTLKELLGLPTDSICMVSVGNTYSPGSMTNLLKAFDDASKSESRLYLILLGNFRKYGNLGRHMDRIIQSFCQNPGFRMIELGSVSLGRMHHYLETCDFVVLPMDYSSIDRARFPIRLGDYIGHRKLIVSNAVGEVKQILNRYQLGLICDPDDLAEFSANMVAACRLHLGYGLCKAGAFAQVMSDYSWENLARQWNEMYTLP